MERITSHQVVGLMEAYVAVYTPQINEEQVWEEVESWVNSLLEEGYDLSEYTWEEMYEEYITEIGVNFGGQKAVDKVRTDFAAQKKSNSQLDAARAQRFGGVNPVVKAAKGGVQGTLDKTSGKWTPTKAAPTAARPATPAPAARPAPTAARPATPAPAARPAPTAARPATPAPAGAPVRNGFGAPTAPMAARSSVSSVTAPTPTATPAPTPTATPVVAKPAPKPAAPGAGRDYLMKRQLNQNFDIFDVIKGHLIDEGYADTEEAALQIMANMSEEWRESIVEGIADRTANAVGHQRAGTHGDADEIRKNEDSTSASISKIKRGSGAKVTPTLPGA